MFALLCGSICVFVSGCAQQVLNKSQSESLVATPNSVNLGSVAIGEATSATVSFANQGSTAVNVTGLTISGQFFSVAGQSSVPVAIAPGSTYSVNVSFVPSIVGQATGQLSITSNAASSPLSVSLSGSGANPVPALSISSASLKFGSVPVAVTSTRTVTLTSAGSSPLTIDSATVSGAGFSVPSGGFPIFLSPGQSTTLSVQFDASTAGVATGQVILNSTAEGPSTIALSATGYLAGSFAYSGSPLENTLIPPDPTAPISNNYFGMTIHHTSTPFPDFPVSTFRFWDVAAWSSIETSSGTYDWSHMDTSIAIGKANGVSDYIFTFGSVPAWASTNPTDPCIGGDGTGACGAPDMTAFDEFATHVVQRYCGTVKYYETWNEPDNSPYWDGTNAQLLTVAQHLYSIAKSPANCGCTNGVCTPNGGTNPNKVLLPPINKISSNTLAWLDSFLASTGSQYPYADVATFHGYKTANPEDIASEVEELDKVLANHGLGSLELWDTEAAWAQTTEALDETQASWLMRYQVVQAVSGVSRFVWYAYDDCAWGTLWEAPWCSNPQMTVSQTTVPGQAYPVVQNWISGASLASCREYENGLWACELKRAGGYDAWMLWSSTGSNISVPITSNAGFTVYRDWLNNAGTLGSELMVGQMPVLLENQQI